MLEFTLKDNALIPRDGNVRMFLKSYVRVQQHSFIVIQIGPVTLKDALVMFMSLISGAEL